MPYDPDTGLGGSGRQFPATRHSLIQAAVTPGSSAREALDAIISAYWKPAYKHVRIRWNRTNDQAKDLVQSFFTALIEDNLLARFDPAKGRLRTFLRTCLDHYVMKQDQSASRLKRGGDVEFTFDFDAAERELASTAPSAEDVFLRESEREMFALALDDLRAVCRAAGKHSQLGIFEQYDLADDPRPSYAELAAEHNIPVTSVTNYLAWTRRELRRLLRDRLDRS